MKKLILKFNIALNKHLSKMVEKRKERFLDKKKVRGLLVTFLTKTTKTRMINIIRETIQSAIASEVKEAKMYSVQTDSTQDISHADQCLIIVL